MTLEELRKLKVGDKVVATIRRFGQSGSLRPIVAVDPENAGLVSLSTCKCSYSWVHADEVEFLPIPDVTGTLLDLRQVEAVFRKKDITARDTGAPRLGYRWLFLGLSQLHHKIVITYTGENVARWSGMTDTIEHWAEHHDLFCHEVRWVDNTPEEV